MLLIACMLPTTHVRDPSQPVTNYEIHVRRGALGVCGPGIKQLVGQASINRRHVTVTAVVLHFNIVSAAVHAIMATLSFLMEDDCLTVEQANDINVIFMCASHMQRLVNDVLDLAKLRDGSLKVVPEPVSLAIPLLPPPPPPPPPFPVIPLLGVVAHVDGCFSCRSKFARSSVTSSTRTVPWSAKGSASSAR